MVRKDNEYPARDPYRALAGELGIDGARVAANDAVTTGPLGHVKSLVCRLDQGFARIAVAREHGDAQAQGKIGDRLSIQQHRLAADRPTNPFGDGDRRPAVSTPQDEHELVAAVAGHQVPGSHRGYQDLAGE